LCRKPSKRQASEAFASRQIDRARLAVLKCRPERERGAGKIGIEHFGFQVEDVEGTLAKLSENGGTSLGNRVDVTPTDAYSPRSYYELKCVGPDDQIIDVSGSGWVGAD
jgi:glyoxalase/bleomycin resistance protein/dioxygenase superfamily protein